MSQHQLGFENVASAFEGGIYPQDDPIIHASSRIVDQDMVRLFKDKDWRSITYGDVWRWKLDLHELTDRAFAYFMPAFLTHAVDLSEDFGYFLIHSLLLPEDDQALVKFERRISYFTLQQKAIISDFINSLIENGLLEPDEITLKSARYWESFR